MTDTNDQLEAFKTAKPGTVVIYVPSRRSPELRDRVTLDHRKDDGSGWWLVEGGGLDDSAFAQGPWRMGTEGP